MGTYIPPYPNRRSRRGLGLQSNLKQWVDDEARVQTDGWKAYYSLDTEKHDVVNHSKKFVQYRRGRKITINALEGCHGVIKRKARNMNLFVGHPTSSATSLQLKLDELVFRFNNRSHDDLFVVFLGILLANRHSQPPDTLLALFKRLHL